MSLHLFLPKSIKRTNSMFAESLKDVFFPVEKQNLYVRNNLGNGIRLGDGSELYIPVGSLSYVGECLINMDDHTVYQIGKHIRHTPTQDLIEQVMTEYGKFTPNIIYYSKNKSDISINIYFEERHITRGDYNFKLALEICNYYSGRYNPKMTLGLYDTKKNMIIRTSVLAFHDNGDINIAGIREVGDTVSSGSIVLLDYDVVKLLPKKYPLILPMRVALLTALNNVAEITNKWLETNYELATTTQRKIYDILLTKTIEE